MVAQDSMFVLDPFYYMLSVQAGPNSEAVVEGLFPPNLMCVAQLQITMYTLGKANAEPSTEPRTFPKITSLSRLQSWSLNSYFCLK